MKLPPFIFATALLVCSLAMADDVWTLTTADFHQQPVRLKSLDDAGVHVTGSDGAESVVPMARFLSLGHGGSVAAGGDAMTLFLVSGDRLAGKLVSLKDDVLSWKSDAMGDLDVSLRNVRAIAPASASGEVVLDRQEDQISLNNKDSVRGAVSGIDADNISIQSGGATVSVPRAAMAAMFLSVIGHGEPPAHGFRLILTDGSILTATALGAKDGKLEVEVPGKTPGTKGTILVERVVSIEQINGPVSWLSSRVPSRNEQVSFSAEETWPARMDQNVRGGPIKFNSHTFERGIGVHANSTLSWALDGSYKVFRTQYAIDGSADARYASVTVRVLLDDKVAHEQANFTAGKLAKVVEVDLGSAKTLTLQVVTGTDNFGTQDRLNWIEPALLRDKPAPPPAPVAVPASLPASAFTTAP